MDLAASHYRPQSTLDRARRHYGSMYYEDNVFSADESLTPSTMTTSYHGDVDQVGMKKAMSEGMDVNSGIISQAVTHKPYR